VTHMTLILADDHTVVRHGLRTLLEAEPDFTVVGEASDGQQVLDLVERLKPTVAIIDLMMPGLNGLEVVNQISQRVPQTRTLVLSMYSSEAYIVAALRNGAGGYVLKSDSAVVLTEAVRAVATGRRYLCPSLSERAIDVYAQKATPAAFDLFETLTLREREIFQLVAEGNTNTRIGHLLSISPRTVEVHRTHVMQKLELKSQADWIRCALRRGILPMEE